MAGEKDGEYILLYGDLDYLYIKGVVDKDQAQAELDKEGLEVKVRGVRHTYAFWGVGQDEVGEPCSVFYVRETSGRGRFKVTEIEYERIL